ncbi:pIIIa [Bovine adenovirus 7]|uniref:PIIIa protein n=1 Tax=Bovine adenovirus 7 TaxID=10511 RepID=A0A7R7IYG1_ADEB7|nr:pIIIa [Bovine adenovirus 7]BCO10924.1 pIIIa [Bovine adenovirus 7]BCS90517.1 pIIIa [Bovine adenovirus 7]
MDYTLKKMDWNSNIIDKILSDKSSSSVISFQKQPLANKLSILESAVVPARKNQTPDMIASLLKELVVLGAIKASEVGPMYSDLLIRVHKYNSVNVQNNLESLMGDIRGIQSDIIRSSDIPYLANQTILNSFLNSLPSTTALGQHNYEAFKQTLRLFVNETPNVTLFKSGSTTLMQINITGVHTVNLNDAFKNLSNLWGVVIQGENLPGNISSRLNANTRVLLYFLAPYTNDNTFSPDTFLSALMRLYRLTVSSALDYPEETETEVQDTAKEIGSDGLKLTQTLGYLLKNKGEEIQPPKSLSPRQLQVLRYIQKSLFDRIERNHENPEDALETLSYSFSPSFYELNGPFIRRLITYMEFALRNSPTYFREIYSNKYWTPPASFWTQNYADFFTEIAKREERFEGFNSRELPLQSSERENIPFSEEFQSAISPSLAESSLPVASNSEYSSLPVSAFYPLRQRIQESISKAVIPPLTGYVGRQIGETILPGSGDMVAPAASLVAAQLLDTRYNHRRQRLKEAAKRRHRYIRENIPEDKSDVSEDDTVITPILGNGCMAVPNKYEHLKPKSSYF